MLVSPNKLSTVLQALFLSQSREVISRILNGQLETPDLTHWVDRAVKVVSPFIQEYYQHGMRKTAVKLGIVALSNDPQPRVIDRVREIAARDGGKTHYLPVVNPQVKSLPKLSAIIVAKAVRKAADAILYRGRTKSGFNPKVLDAVNQACLHFCRETIETATTDLDTALEGVRVALRRHLRYDTRYGPRDQPKRDQDSSRLTPEQYKRVLKSLAASVYKLFNDPYRANRIAVTEFSRAINAGAVIEAKAAPFRTVKVWRSSIGSCKECKKLNLKKRNLDKPFIVLPEPGPYSHIMHPPYHPHCDCKMDIVRA